MYMDLITVGMALTLNVSFREISEFKRVLSKGEIFMSAK
jgi:hypothetical protein